jgi:hypothetical protein
MRNGHTDTSVVNLPDNIRQAPQKGLKVDPNLHIPFVYAEILPPGYHQFLLFDPQTEALWYKEFILDSNLKDQFPECPKNFYSIQSPERAAVDIWRRHRESDMKAIFDEQIYKGKTDKLI